PVLRCFRKTVPRPCRCPAAESAGSDLVQQGLLPQQRHNQFSDAPLSSSAAFRGATLSTHQVFPPREKRQAGGDVATMLRRHADLSCDRWGFKYKSSIHRLKDVAVVLGLAQLVVY